MKDVPAEVYVRAIQPPPPAHVRVLRAQAFLLALYTLKGNNLSIRATEWFDAFAEYLRGTVATRTFGGIA